jgi:TPR repeat protein
MTSHTGAGGLGVEQHNETALSYYQKAAKEKSPGAYVGMGLLYKYGALPSLPTNTP